MCKDKKRKERRKKKRPAHKSKMITGYIIYASEIRKDVIKKFPDRDFGDISKLVGIEWKNLPQEVKVAYEKRAQEQNAKSRIEAFRLKKLADAAAEQRAKEQAEAPQGSSTPLATVCLGYKPASSLKLVQDQRPSKTQTISNNQVQQMQSNQQHDPSKSLAKSTMQQPLQIIQQQPIATTVQYCSNSTGCNSHLMHQDCNSPQSPMHQQIQYQKNNIVYRKPATVRLRPKDATTQTEPMKWVDRAGMKKPLRFSQKFIDYLNASNLNHHTLVHGSDDLSTITTKRASLSR